MKLRRQVPRRTVISSGAGLALATVAYTSNMQVASYVAGDSAWIAILTAGIISIFASFCFSELVGMYPTAAGIKLFIEKAFNERAALILAGLYVTISVFVVGAETYILSNVFQAAVPGVPMLFWIFLILTAIALMNIRGIRLAGNAQDLTAYFMFASLLAVSLYALFRGGFDLESPLQPGEPMGFLQAVAVGIFLYLGFEWVTPLVEEVTDFKLIPQGMLGAVGLLAVTYALFSVAMTSTVAKELLASTPIPHVLFAREIFGPAGVGFMLLMSLVASITTFNAGLMTASRFVYALSRDRALPAALSRLHPPYATPWAAILFLFLIAGAVSMAIYLTGAYKVLIFMGAAVECILYVVVALAVLNLRRREPGRERPFRIPGGPTIPVVVAFIYGALLLLVFVPDPSNPGDAPEQLAALVTLVLTLAGIALYVFFGVPRLRAAYAARRAARRRRRPHRPKDTSANS